ncbi:MAG: ABC transporter ATP-binding protein, partial [Rhizomicrobium sp.]
MSAIVFDAAEVRFGDLPVLRGVSAGFEAGTLTGIIGPNGAGKTTLLRAALGLVPLSGGTVRVLDKPLTAWRRTALARQLAYLPQGGGAVWPVTAREVVMLGRLPYRPRLNRLTAADLAAVDAALARADATAFAAR